MMMVSVLNEYFFVLLYTVIYTYTEGSHEVLGNSSNVMVLELRNLNRAGSKVKSFPLMLW